MEMNFLFKNEALAPQKVAENTVAATKWVSLKTIDWIDDKGKQRKWDYVNRTTKQPDVPDAVIIVPVLKSKKHRTIDTLLVEQFRPPVNKVCLEFPAGLVDRNESAQDAAVRELEEETGYIGAIDTTFSQEELCMTPGLTDETVQIVVVNVDLDDPRNNKPVQKQEASESIHVKRVPLTKGLKQVLSNSSSMPISLLYSFAIGLEMGAKIHQK